MSEQEFNNAIIELKPTMKRFALKLTKDAFRADDLVQDTYLCMVRSKNTFIEGNIKSWMCTIMRNTFINTYRQYTRCKRKKEVFLPDTFVLEKVDANTPESILQNKELRQNLEKRIGQIKFECRKSLQMFVDGYRYEEIAEMFDCPLGTIKNRIFTARRELMKHFNKNLN
jgi:RNA polymerase sigma-70 factor (ECF subfamily)